ncbi:MAG: S24 family peptidase [Rhizobiaceae bacterium]|nr:S24 family peptidase [Rhizobiaceae bacterium]
MNAITLHQNLDDLPAAYGLIYRGHDIEPEFRNGDMLCFEKNGDAEAGDVVAVWLRPEHVREGRSQVAVYRVHMPLPPGFVLPFDMDPDAECMPVLILLSLSDPKRVAPFPADRLLGVHRLASVVFRESEGEEGGEQ